MNESDTNRYDRADEKNPGEKIEEVAHEVAARVTAARDFAAANSGHGGSVSAAVTDALRGAPATAQFDLEHIFQYHAPGGEQLAQYGRLREAAKRFAIAIVQNSPAGADQSAAIRHVREAVMTANAAIALGGRINR